MLVYPKLIHSGDNIKDDAFYRQKCALTMPFKDSIGSLLHKSSFNNWRELYELVFGVYEEKTTNVEGEQHNADDLRNLDNDIHINIFEQLSNTSLLNDPTVPGWRLMDLNFRREEDSLHFENRSVARMFLDKLYTTVPCIVALPPPPTFSNEKKTNFRCTWQTNWIFIEE